MSKLFQVVRDQPEEDESRLCQFSTLQPPSRLQALLDKSKVAIQEAGGRLSKTRLTNEGPGRTGEFRRILNLPTRPAAEPDEELRVLMTQWLRLPEPCPFCAAGDCDPNQYPVELRDSQARGIAEAVENAGALCQFGVGAGKTLGAILTATAFKLECGIDRTGILVPSKLVKPFKRAVERARRHWRVLPSLEDYVVGYGRLSLAGNEDLLVHMGCGAWICDEAHSLRDKKSARTRRFERLYKEQPATRFVGLSGTFLKNSPLDYWHLAKLALGDAKAPVPKSWPEMADWAFVVAPDPALPMPPAPGCIEELGQPGDTPGEAYARRVLSTPGIVSTKQSSVDASIAASILMPKLPTAIADAVDSVLSMWEVPDGHVIVDASGMHRAVSQLCLGFYSKLVFPEGSDREGWYEARREWSRFLREAYRKWSMKLDSELPVINAIKDGRLKDPQGVYAKWKKIREEVVPWDEVVWLDDQWAAKVVTKWLGKRGGLVWTHWVPVGEQIARVTGVPYYGAGTDPEADAPFESAVLSVMAHFEGRNLQFANRNLLLTQTPSGAVLQQLIGRTHRQGQRADMVEVDFYAPVDLTREKIDAARLNARFLQEQTKEPQKLNMADWSEDEEL